MRACFVCSLDCRACSNSNAVIKCTEGVCVPPPAPFVVEFICCLVTGNTDDGQLLGEEPGRVYFERHGEVLLGLNPLKGKGSACVYTVPRLHVSANLTSQHADPALVPR